MTFDTASGLAVIVCIGLLIFGVVKRFPWFIIQGSLVNGAMVILCFYVLGKIIANVNSLGGIGAVLLSLLVLGFGAICCSNLRAYLTGEEARNFYNLVREKIKERQGDAD